MFGQLPDTTMGFWCLVLSNNNIFILLIYYCSLISLNVSQDSQMALHYQGLPFIVSTLSTAAYTPYQSVLGFNADQISGLSFCILLVTVCRSTGCLSEWDQLSAGKEAWITLGTESDRAGSQVRYWRIHIAFSWSIRTCNNSDMACCQMSSHCGTQCSISISFTHCSNILLAFVASFTQTVCMQKYVWLCVCGCVNEITWYYQSAAGLWHCYK